MCWNGIYLDIDNSKKTIDVKDVSFDSEQLQESLLELERQRNSK